VKVPLPDKRTGSADGCALGSIASLGTATTTLGHRQPPIGQGARAIDTGESERAIQRNSLRVCARMGGMAVTFADTDSALMGRRSRLAVLLTIPLTGAIRHAGGSEPRSAETRYDRASPATSPVPRGSAASCPQREGEGPSARRKVKACPSPT